MDSSSSTFCRTSMHIKLDSNIKVSAVVKTMGPVAFLWPTSPTKFLHLSFIQWVVSACVSGNHDEAIILKVSPAVLWYGRLTRCFIFALREMTHLTRAVEGVNEKAVEYFWKAFYIFVFVCQRGRLECSSLAVIPVAGVTSARWHVVVWLKRLLSSFVF